MDFMEVIAMNKEKPQGLCITCIYVPMCKSAKNSDSPIIYCEEFEYRFPPTPEKVEIAGKTSQKAWDQFTEERKDNFFKGLCINCENSKTCTLPKPEGGVWHCEEYR